jgi:hypothetical protein
VKVVSYAASRVDAVDTFFAIGTVSRARRFEAPAAKSGRPITGSLAHKFCVWQKQGHESEGFLRGTAAAQRLQVSTWFCCHPERNRMRASKIICFTVGVMLSAAATQAEEIQIVSNVLGPEGPLYIDGNLYYVGWVSNTLSKWDGKTTTVLNHTP